MTAEHAPDPRAASSGEVTDLLEEEIVLGLRYPRERLVEDELMERYAAKRHVVRSALKELETRGLAVRRPNVGAFVRAYTAKEVHDIYAVRELLEVHCARTIGLPAPRARWRSSSPSSGSTTRRSTRGTCAAWCAPTPRSTGPCSPSRTTRPW
ncbi:GntR family transcriptional regulator [Streptomyces zhihengii]